MFEMMALCRYVTGVGPELRKEGRLCKGGGNVMFGIQPSETLWSSTFANRLMQWLDSSERGIRYRTLFYYKRLRRVEN